MGKLIDTDGLETVLIAANNTFLKRSGGTVTGNVVFAGGSGKINDYDIEGWNGNRWGIVPIVEKNAGTMEVGTYIRFHTSETDTTTGAVVLQASSNGELNLNGDPIVTENKQTQINLTNSTSAPAYFWACGHCATLIVSGTTPSGQWGTSSTICTIPQAYRPPTTIYFPVQKDGNTQSDSYLIVNQNGAVTVQNAGGTQSAVAFRVTATWAFL